VPFVVSNPATALAFLTELTFICMLILLRYGLVRQASLVYLAGTSSFAIALIALSGGTRSNAIVLYTMLPISAAWLLGYSAALWTALACLGSAAVLALLETIGVGPWRFLPGLPVGVWFILAQSTVMGAVPVAHTLKILKEALAQAQSAQEALRQQQVRLREELAQRQRSEQALRESEERFRNLADTAPVGIWVSGPDELLTFYNKRALAFTGRSMDQLTGDRWTELVHPDDVDTVSSVYRSAVAVRRGFRVECRMRRDDGQYRWVLNTGIPRFANRIYLGHIGTVFDTTDLKRNHEQMIATEKLESLGVLAAGIAHDFNNMLGTIFAEADVALMDTTSDSPGRENIERIKAVAVRASEIVKLLMAYAGDTEEPTEAVDLSAIVEETLGHLRGTISERAELHIDLARDLPPVQVNASQIRQVALNLIMNAVEALEDKRGHIAVTTDQTRVSRSAAPDPIGLPDGQYVTLEVSDTGCGMTPEVQALAFDPFYSTKFLGRGLGLAVVHGIVRSHGGGIHVRSKPGSGTTFEVVLPCTGGASGKTLRINHPGGHQKPSLALETALIVQH
jgi:PAS domain S-box-containing protein